MIIQVYVMAHRAAPNYRLLQWLNAWKLPWKRGSQVGFAVDIARNQTVNAFMQDDVPRGVTHLLMLDADMIPIIATNGIVSAPADVAYCAYAGHCGTHGHRSDLGAGCVRLSADVIAKMQRPAYAMGRKVPLFKVRANRTHDNVRHCECLALTLRAKWAGYSPQKVGTIGHQQGGDSGVVVFPNDKNKTGFSLCWPHELPYSP